MWLMHCQTLEHRDLKLRLACIHNLIGEGGGVVVTWGMLKPYNRMWDTPDMENRRLSGCDEFFLNNKKKMVKITPNANYFC